MARADRLEASATRDGTVFTAGELLISLLWTTMWITCVKRRYTCAHIGEMLGNPLLVRPGIRTFTWANTVHALCINKEPKLSTHHTEATDK